MQYAGTHMILTQIGCAMFGVMSEPVIISMVVSDSLKEKEIVTQILGTSKSRKYTDFPEQNWPI